MYQLKKLVDPFQKNKLKIFCLTLNFLLITSYVGNRGSGNANSLTPPKGFEEIGVDEHLGDKIDLESLEFLDENGKKVFLKNFFKGDKPIILILGYYECPRLCSLVFNGFSLSAKSLEWSIGKEFDVVTVSINPEEKPALAKEKKSNYVNHYGRLSAHDGWHFLTGDKKNTEKLARQLGYKYKYDPKIEQYAHAAVIMTLTPKGEISRYLYGIDFKHNDLKLALLEASKGTIGTTVEQLLLYCFHYDPDSNSYSFTIVYLMKIAGLLTLIILGGYLFKFWRKEIAYS